MPLNIHNTIFTINSSLIIILFISIFLYNTNTPFTFHPTYNNNNIYNLNFFYNNKINILNTQNNFFVTLLKTISLLSFIPLFISIFLNSPDIVISFNNWITLNSFSINLEFHYDIKFNLFFSIALTVSSSILEFSQYYMNNDPNKNNFFHLLIIFLLNMIILTSSNNLFILFIGWEGVGFLSFLLISWWFTRTNANNAAIQAIIYNRIGDIGLLLFFTLILINLNTWSISSINISNIPALNITLIGVLIAAAGKSAQFGLHPWLPAAMEGPTPVSALLHSSTMVVAGIFLLIRISPLYNNHPNFNTWCLILGAITALFAATTATSQHDIKKIIAYSTTSQLGLMMVAIGLNQPNIALFHICTHAFFKAMLFLSSGSIIHNLADEQDLRKMGGLYFILPNTAACILLGSLALSGIPFLAGFYSKDLILEISLINFSNLLSITFAFIATLLTAVYSTRILIFSFINIPSYPSLIPVNEENNNLTNALNRLAIGTILSGWIITTFIIFINPINISFMLKSIALIITFTALFYSIPILTIFNQTNLSSVFYFINTFTTWQWFYEKASHLLISKLILIISLTLSTRNTDQGWNEYIGPQGIGLINYSFSQSYQSIQSGYIKHYLLMSSTILSSIILLNFIYNTFS
uniref:NADH-ubiquinone oxidoreductase chain 5 n=1 Tax=Freyastera benthophila TaxID=556872 RepID=A0A451EI61_9ECHI|nr:NADH dehydrogenase subunit 5 [Freyastera benthophila]AYR06727.1 NADH dehydrogenase subunit 5 [Freyastera benthophila]